MVRENLPALSPSETEILRLVWQLDRATVQEVCEKLPAKRRITYATVQTLLRRLEKKGYLKHAVNGKAHVFSAAVKRESVVKRSVGDFLDLLSESVLQGLQGHWKGVRLRAIHLVIVEGLFKIVIHLEYVFV